MMHLNKTLWPPNLIKDTPHCQYQYVRLSAGPTKRILAHTSGLDRANKHNLFAKPQIIRRNWKTHTAEI